MALEIFTLKDMAEYFGVTKQYIHKLKNEDANFPKPIEKKGRVHLYTKKQVLAYGKLRDFSNPHPNRLERMKKEENEHGESE
ncbi:DNA binding protein [Bacillus phage 031MP004]|nr:DNA binding protein [Bacillus phage 022DV001]QFG05443.1 DNA binding protein [Bacillus phage 031MP003]QFG05532.1 DNA binding protein [Bacillus phage 031MP002]QFG05619.1 DNA binding protein [Bacillus phage 031MP004]QFG05793.1 DNA binding protein [Bacillus phage 055SW001]